ncbi:MMPL family transporter [Nocardioides piscis]|uniref:MMPL family transporter n=1 Tax=Nocardioides piscis TaxID=2714938 RepID=A0A6G7YFG5_9ACTN|nr:MMPL family transporter [Nocardioides piscis]QIK75469.1 MMPL family transporter [Nocardioides piscis]
MNRRLAGALTGRATKWAVLIVWLLIAAGSAGFAAKLTDVQNNEASSWLPESAESTRALAKLAPFQDPDSIPTLVVYERAGGLTEDDLAAIEVDASEFAELEGVAAPVEGRLPPIVSPALAAQAGFPAVSEDGEVAQTQITFDLGSEGWEKLPDIADELREIAAIDGGQVYIAGTGGQASDSAEAFGGIDSTLLFATLSVVIIILLFTYRSPVLWVLPIICAGVSLFSAQALIYFLAKYADLTVNGQSQAILTILVIGAGTDYALLLVARYREELRRHEDRHEAMSFALHRAAPAILASASTVVLGMLCLLFADMNSTAGLGPVAAIGITVTFVVMVTLLPALLVIAGRWVFWPRRATFGSAEPTQSGIWAKVGRAIAPRPRPVWVGTTILLAVACLGLLTLDTNGLTSEETYTTEFESVTGQQALVDHGLVDQSNKVLIVANADQADAVRDAATGIEGVEEPSPPVSKDGVAFIEATIDDDPSTRAAFETVERVRTAVHDVDGADALVGGGSAFFLDTLNASERDSIVIIPIILVVVLLILMALLRSILAPLILIATVVLSFGAALGLSSLLFKYVFGFAGADPSFPLFAFVFLVALGIDYNIFLMTRVREETMHLGTRRGSLVALTSTGGVITSAGLVLAATFLVLGTIPLVFLVELGVAVALGVILDTMIVRSVLVTAINMDLGGKIWWPSKLDRDDHRLTPEEIEAPIETVH